MIRVPALVPLLLLSACLGDGEPIDRPGAGPSRVAYECDRGTSFTVAYRRNGATVRTADGQRFALKRAPSTAGDAYEGGGYNLRVIGDTATWSGRTREAPQTCRRVPLLR